MNFDFGNANDEQKEVIMNTDGPVLIIAGPGTGKTFTLVKRVVYLIVEKRVCPENIMVVTFTEKAAKELITRISNELLQYGISLNINEMYIGTFHSICLRLIKENIDYSPLKKNFRVMDDFEQKYFIYQNLRKFRQIDGYDCLFSGESGRWYETEKIAEYCNILSEELVDVNGLIESNEKSIKAMGRLLNQYQSLLEENNCIDFAHIQVIAHDMLFDNIDLITQIKEKIKYVMVDEYQDTNYIQEKIVLKITEDTNNICVVGDDDQGLYRFRGATIRNILEFPNKFPQIKQYKLVRNYRSEKDIVRFYNEYMQETDTKFFNFGWDKYRFDKKIIANKPNIYDGTSVCKLDDKDFEGWCCSTLALINDLLNTSKINNLNQIAFLFKSVKHDRALHLAEFLEKNSIPVYSPRSDMYFKRDEIKLIIGALIVLFPNYYSKLSQGVYKDLLKEELQNYYLNCVAEFYKILSAPQNLSFKNWIKFRAKDHVTGTDFNYGIVALFYQLMQFKIFEKELNSEVKGVNDTRAVRNLAKFSGILNKFEYFHNLSVFTPKNIDNIIELFFNNFLRFLISGGINEYEDESEYAPSGCVSFLTIHQSKGLEFPVVFVGSLYSVPRTTLTPLMDEIEKDYYHRKPFEPADLIKLYDFWRLYYTAFSRAQNMLILTACTATKREPSKYFEEMFKSIPKYSIDLLKTNQKFDVVKDTNLKETYAFTSNILVYQNCPLQYKLIKEFGFTPARIGSTVYGTLVHSTIEDIHKLALNNEVDKITSSNIREIFDTNYTLITLKEKTFLGEAQKESAFKQIEAYIDRQNGDWSKVKDAEVEVSLVKDKYILKGKIDLIQGENDTLELVDFKAEKKPDLFKEKEKINIYRHQLEVYAHIVEGRFGCKVSKTHIYYTGESNGNPLITFKRNEENISETIKNFDIIVDKIQNKDFSGRSCSQKLCSNCDFRFYCKRQ